MTTTHRRPSRLRRSWLFLAGADHDALVDGAASGADVLIQELETFTPPDRRPAARELSERVLAGWRDAGILASVRVNPLDAGGIDDLRAAMRGRPDIVMMSYVATPEQVVALDEAVTRFEREYDIAPGSTELVPNIESTLGLVNTMAIARSSPRVSAVLVATEDMVADMGAERTRAGRELDYVRSRFRVECAAVGVTAIDCPYSYADNEGAELDMRVSRGLGYHAKAIVNAQFVPVVNRVLTPTADEVALARRVIDAFDTARRASGGRRVAAAVVDGFLAEVPDYLAAHRLIARATQFGIA
ncbi:HpcH/HpaI aldolase/citrate lyase family protein [Burkholderia cepacia]|uniref:HpcH/HpaI aldolase/citrate lyase family protein n=1 Tax=Burkholderia cepacia TaxID=292 RepID=UPI000F5D7974|nr:CoA ester lyase [Burkholderia cepacia]MCA8031203.1 CoA ester lyase [Burkholderia cepacia]RRA16045.1 CoA ester lyase [Burkholderia cepacia]